MDFISMVHKTDKFSMLDIFWAVFLVFHMIGNKNHLRNQKKKFRVNLGKKKMLLLFFEFSFSVWWDYNQNEYPEYEKNSYKHPIFAVCTSPHCPHCKGLPEILRMYSDMIGNSSKVVFTSVSCASGDLCGRIPVRAVPAFVLIRGPDPKYWIQTYERNYMGWNKFLEQHINAKAIEIKDAMEINTHVSKTYRGGTTYYLTVPDQTSVVFKAFKKLVPIYAPMSCTFVYRFDGKSTKITAYKSSSCVITNESITSTNIAEFVEKNRFSSYHHFGRLELYKLAMNNVSVFVTICEEYVNEYQQLALDRLSTQFCGKIEFGWAEKTADYEIVSFSRMSRDDVPFYFAMNPEKKCFHVQKGNPQSPEVDEFIKNNINAINCKKMPGIHSGYRIQITKTSLIVAGIIAGILCLSYFIWEISRDSLLKLE